MTEQMATILTKKLIHISPMHQSREAIIRYGIELIISSGIVLVLMHIISVILCRSFSWVWFVLGFAPLRSAAGGYHATSHLRCYVVSSCLFAGCLILEKFVEYHVCGLAFLTGVAWLLVLRYSPIEAVNKRLSKEKRKHNRKKSIVLASVAFAISILVCYTGERIAAVGLYLLGTTAASLSLVIAKKQRRREEDL